MYQQYEYDPDTNKITVTQDGKVLKEVAVTEGPEGTLQVEKEDSTVIQFEIIPDKVSGGIKGKTAQDDVILAELTEFAAF